jgi:hypothetical protein
MIKKKSFWKESLIEVLAYFFQSFRFGLLLGIIMGVGIMYWYSMPRLFERRAKDLGILHYNAKDDTMIPYDTIVLNEYEWRYLRNGKFTRDFSK